MMEWRPVLRASFLLHTSWLDEIDFTRLEVVKTTFIRRDYRHLASDLVYTAPLVGGRRSCSTRACAVGPKSAPWPT